MTGEQRAALEALRAAHAIYRQADAHRTEMMGLCKTLGLTVAQMNKVLA